MDTEYIYLIEDDFPNQKVDLSRLSKEINESDIKIALRSTTTTEFQCFIYFKDILSDIDSTSLTTIVQSHSGVILPEAPPVDPELRMADGRMIIRADSRPLDFQTYYTMVGDDSTAGIGMGQDLAWDFTNDDDLVTGDHVPSGMKCKEFHLTFLCPAYTKDGALYFFEAPWGAFVMLDVCIPPGEWYPNAYGTVTGEQLGIVGDTSKYANTGTEWVMWSSYVMKYRMCGTCSMGDELNAEGSSINPIPIGWAIRGRVYTPTSDNVSKGFAELELHRCHSTLLPGQTLADMAAEHDAM